MREFVINAARLRSALAVYEKFLELLKAPYWYSMSINALVDTMVYHDNMNGINPPYRLRFINLAAAPKEVRDEITFIAAVMEDSLDRCLLDRGARPDISFELRP